MNNKTFILLIAILIIVAGLSLNSYLPARSDVALRVKVADFPKEFGQWTSIDIPLSESEYDILETRNLFVREYKNKKGDSVHLYLIYSEDNRKVSHPPEICLLGSGVTIVDKSQVKISDSINAVKLIVEKEDIPQMVIYWYKAGALFTDKYLKQQIKIVTDRMLRKRTSGAMIRVSTPIKDDDKQSALALIKSFCSEITPLLSKYIP